MIHGAQDMMRWLRLGTLVVALDASRGGSKHHLLYFLPAELSSRAETVSGFSACQRLQGPL